MYKMSSVLILILLIFSSTTVSAEEYPYIYKGIRPLGMGGAYVAVSDDANALFYNPAGLSYVKENKLSLLTLEVEEGQGAYDASMDLLDIDPDNISDITAFLRDYMGEYQHIAVATFPHYERPHFAFGIIGTANSNFLARNYQNPSLIVKAVGDAGPAIGYAHSLLDDKLSLGASLKYIMRRSVDKEYSIIDLTEEKLRDLLKDDYDDGSGALLDVGIMYRGDSIKMADYNVIFQTGLSANNFIGSDMGDAEDIDYHVDLGFSALFEPWTVAMDYVDIFSHLGHDNDPVKRIRVGVEYVYDGFLVLRTGVYQGYPTIGIGFKSKYAQIDLLSYCEEVGTYSGQMKDRRYTLGLAFGF